MLKVLGNEVRLRLLLALCLEARPCTLYRLLKITGLDRRWARKNMKDLESAGLVKAESHGISVTYMFDPKKKEETEALINLFHAFKLDDSNTYGLSRNDTSWNAQKS